MSLAKYSRFVDCSVDGFYRRNKRDYIDMRKYREARQQVCHLQHYSIFLHMLQSTKLSHITASLVRQLQETVASVREASKLQNSFGTF